MEIPIILFSLYLIAGLLYHALGFEAKAGAREAAKKLDKEKPKEEPPPPPVQRDLDLT